MTVLLLYWSHVLLVLGVLWLVAGAPTRHRQQLIERRQKMLAALHHAMQVDGARSPYWCSAHGRWKAQCAAPCQPLILRHPPGREGLAFFCTHCGEPAGWSCKHVAAGCQPRPAPVAVHSRPRASDLRIGDTERDAALAQLREHYAAGRLTYDELPGRLDAALAARTRQQLDTVLADLPAVPGLVDPDDFIRTFGDPRLSDGSY